MSTSSTSTSHSQPQPHSNSNSSPAVGYAHAYPHTDARTRGRVKLPSTIISSPPTNPLQPQLDRSDVFRDGPRGHLSSNLLESTSLPIQIDSFFRFFVSKSLYALALFLISSTHHHSNADPHSSILIQASIILFSGSILSLLSNSARSSSPELHQSTPNSKLGRRLFGPSSVSANSASNKQTVQKPSVSATTALVGGAWMAIEQLSLLYAISQLSVLRFVSVLAPYLQEMYSLNPVFL